MEDEVNDFLAHFGVKGMKWGVRREENSSGGGRSSSTTKTEKAAQKSAKNYEQAGKHRAAAAASAKTLKELDDLGIQSPEMRRLYGNAVNQSDRLFAFAHGTTKQNAVAKAKKNVTADQTRHEKDAQNVAAGGLSRNQKIAIAGGLAAVGIIAAAGVLAYPDIVTRNALPGQKISVNNFMSRYMKRGAAFSDVKKALTKADFDGLDTKDVTVSAGTVFKRLTTDPKEDLGKRLYTTFKEADNDKYQGLYGAVLISRTAAPEVHISEMVMKNAVTSPSTKKRVQLLMDMVNEDDGKKIDFGDGDFKTLRTYLEELSTDMTSFAAIMNGPEKNMSNEKLALKSYNNFARALVVPNPATNAYFDRVKKAGYNALVDDNDRGQLSDLPMILLNGKEDVGSRTTKLLTKSLEKEARKRLTELLDPIKA